MRLLVIGGNSRLGQAIARACPRATLAIRGVASAGSGSVITVGDYRTIAASDFEGYDAIINCTGLVRGSADALRNANAVLPAHLAVCADRAGVRHFVHISSFSVYGRAEQIDEDTPINPVNAYGRSKAEGEQMLAAGQGTTVVRLPSLYGDGASKLSQLIRAWVQLGWWACPKGDIARSMMHYDAAVSALLRLAVGAPRGGVAAADVEPFSYAAARDALGAAGTKVGLLRLPESLVALAKGVGGDRARAILADSRLAGAFNVAADMSLPTRLRSDIATLAGS